MTKNPVLIVHGWSDDYTSFVPLKDLLVAQGHQPKDVFLGRYASMHDVVTFDDVSYGLQTRIKDLVAAGEIAGKLDESNPAGYVIDEFSLDVIVHSTGGPVMRNWLDLYVKNAGSGDCPKSPVRHFIMLAPANFGSRLAAQGKSTLAKLFKGGIKNGFETGRKLLEALELGSPFLWRLAERDLFGEKLYPSGDRGTFVYVLSGTDTYGRLKGLVAKGANENGSDGTIRAAAAALNTIKLNIDFRDPNGRARISAIPQKNDAPVFKLVEGCNHSTIVPNAETADHPIFKIILDCLAVADASQYANLRAAYEKQNDDLYKKNLDERSANPDVDPINRFQQLIVRVVDNMGNAVSDYNLQFHVIDSSIQFSVWDGQTPPPALEQYKEYNETIMNEVISDVQPHSVDPSYRTFFVNIDALNALRATIKSEHPNAFIAMNIDAVPAMRGVYYNTDQIHYHPIDPLVNDGKSIFKENTSTLVEIRFQLDVDKSICNLAVSY
jgi:pimeloyl-ACP methyl ester carboxylesterase